MVRQNVSHLVFKKFLVAVVAPTLFLAGCGGGEGEVVTVAASSVAPTTLPVAAPTPKPVSTPTPATSVPVATPAQVAAPTPLPSGPPAGAACPTANSNVALAGGTQLAVGASRATGVAPLAVFFDASGTISNLTARPFHELEYRWNFGESGSGTWNYGAKAGTASRNLAMGPVAAHVFESAGTYPITVSAFNGTSTVSYSCNITVTSPETEFVGNKTVCVSAAGNFAGCPTGALQVTTTNPTTAVANNMGSGNKRFLFRRGDTFNVASRVMIDKNGPGIIGAFGIGAKPKLVNTTPVTTIQLSRIATPNIADWRIMDLEIDGGGFVNDANVLISAGGSINNTLILRNDFKNHQCGIKFSNSDLDAINNSGFTSPMYDGVFIMDNTSTQLVGTESANGFYVGGWRMAFVGNYIDNGWNGEHGVRSPYSDRSVWQHNTTERVARAHMTLRSPGQGGSTLTAQLGSGAYYTQKLIASDNYFIGGPLQGADTGGHAFLGIGPTNSTSNGRAREAIFERNLMKMGSGTLGGIAFIGSQVTVRNNIAIAVQGSYWPFIVGGYASPYAADNGIPQPTDAWFYHNTMYSSTTLDWKVSAYGASGDPLPTTSTFTYKNNLFYTPNNSATQYQDWINNVDGVTLVRAPTGSNTLLAEMQTSPNFTTNPPTAAAHVKPLTGSYAIGRGTQLPVWSDYFGNTISNGARDIGAVAH